MTGDYGEGSHRNTLCQLGTDEKLWVGCGLRPFALAVQVEISLRLRTYLFQPAHRAELAAFAGAFVEAATKTEATLGSKTGALNKRPIVKSPASSRSETWKDSDGDGSTSRTVQTIREQGDSQLYSRTRSSNLKPPNF